MVRLEPTGIESRSPTGRSAGGHADPLVALAAGTAARSRWCGRAERREPGPARRAAGPPRGRGELGERGPRTKRPCRSRVTSGGARGRRRGGGRSGGPARWTDELARVAGPASRRSERWPPCRGRRLHWSCPCTDTAVSVPETQVRRSDWPRWEDGTSLEVRQWRDAGREGVGRARRAPGRGRADLLYIDLHLCTRSPARRRSTACGSPDARSGAPTSPSRPRTTTSRRRRPDHRPGEPHPGRDAAPQLRGVRRDAAPDGRRRAGHRHVGRPPARSHPSPA
jgi:hypothetical protein